MRKATIAALAVVVVFHVSCCFAGSKVILGRTAPVAQRISMDQINHAAWDALLQKYCDERGLVNYEAWHRSREDQALLKQYLAHLSSADPRRQASSAARMAFWINAYNAVTLQGILREYPTTSIRNHTAKVFGYNIWKDLLLPVGDQTYALEQIENEILRKMGDPRVHFAIVCASMGCPRLLNRAYVPQQLDSQLTINARQFFSDPKRFRYNAAQRQLEVSPILNWYATDFGPNTAAQMRTIAPFLPDQTAQSLAASGQARVSYLGYDWGLNDQKGHVAVGASGTKNGGASGARR